MKKSASRKTSQESATRTPRHGKGRLRTGGKPGNKGGTGRPPSAVRAVLRQAFEDRIPLLAAIASGESSGISDQLKALDILAKYGLGNKIELEGAEGAPPIRFEVVKTTRAAES